MTIKVTLHLEEGLTYARWLKEMCRRQSNASVDDIVTAIEVHLDDIMGRLLPWLVSEWTEATNETWALLAHLCEETEKSAHIKQLSLAIDVIGFERGLIDSVMTVLDHQCLIELFAWRARPVTTLTLLRHLLYIGHQFEFDDWCLRPNYDTPDVAWTVEIR